jgi:multidrug transporter EmrE-like cation transporter
LRQGVAVIAEFAVDSTLFAAYVASSSFGLLLLKRSLSRVHSTGGALLALSPDTFLLAIGFALYVLSFGLWIRILARLPLSTAYPVAIGLTMAFSTTGAVLLLGERFGALKLAGMLLIFLGCVALGLDSE